MDLVLNEEQTILKNSAREFFRARAPIRGLRELRDTRDASGIDLTLWREMGELGWAGILIPETFGGSAFGYQGLGQILEEAGRCLSATPLVSTALTVAPLLVRAGTDAQKAAILPAISNGECTLALALDESPRHAPCLISTRAERHGTGFKLRGKKIFVVDGHVADQVVVVARSAGAVDASDGLTLFLLDAQAAGVRITRTHMVDSRNAALLELDDVEVSAEAVIGEVDHGYAALEPVLDGARAGLAAEMLGCGLEAFERTLEYLKMRKQFDVAIGSFQALKHRAALMFCELELTKSAVLAALWALDSGASDSAELASLAKTKACDMLELVSNEAVQMHGGIGMTDAEDIGLFLKRARVAQQLFGDASFHRDRYATLQGF